MDSSTASQHAENAASARLQRVSVWDLPTRIFHWVLVGLVAVSLITGTLGGTAMDYHERSGVAILVLILFRLIWGFVGGRQARFASFVRGPRQALAYLRTHLGPDGRPYLGHNPLGGWSILAMLATLLLQAGSGLFATDDILTEGPLYHLVTPATSAWLTHVHHLNKTILIAFIALHLGAIVFYLLVKRENLLTPMIFGDKMWPEPIETDKPKIILAFVIVAVLSGGVWLILY